jgi:4-hydroxy-3-polyprenylbenzoate decarboxylase
LAKQDLQTWLAELEAAGDVQHVSGADRETEIGGIVDIYMRKMGRQLLLFDDIPGYQKGFRVMANILTSVPRINRTLGLPPDTSEVENVRYWRDYFRSAKMIPPVNVNGGALMENVYYDGDIDLLKIPTPRWHELDGGYYIGTGCMVIMKDPDSGWINYGAYRIQAHDRQVASVMTSKGKHGNLIMRKYHERGEPGPIAVVVGMHPALFMVAGLEIPYGKNEYDAAGGLLGEPVEIINGPMTGLPIPAHAEIAFEGTVSPNDFVEEGPLGEWTGYYAGGRKPEPAIRISSFMHRNNPILLGAVPAVPPNDDTFYRGTYRSGAIWHQLEAAGVPEVKGVWAHPAGGSRLWFTVAIKQMYGGHSKQAGLIASQCHAGAYANRVVIVVDDDINPADMDEVVWAMCTRMDARDGVQTLNGCWSTHLDPMSYPEGLHAFNSRLVIDACKPWARKDTFPPVARSSKKLDDHIKAKFAKVLPKQ